MGYFTVVYKDPSQDQINKIMLEPNWVALSRDHALDDKGMLEDFVREASNDALDDPGYSARQLMQKMGWA